MDEAGEGESKWLLEMIPKLIFLGIAITVVIVFTALFISNNINTNSLEVDVFFNKLIYSSNALSYHDDSIDRTYLGIIDPDKLNTKNIEEAMEYYGTKYAAKITLEQWVRGPAYYNEKRYNNLYPLAKAEIKGPGGVDYLTKTFKVGVMNNGQVYTKELTIDILKART